MEELKNQKQVVDCSLVTKWYFKEQYADAALLVLERAKEKKIFLYSPEIILIEFANVLTKKNKTKTLSNNECLQSYASFLDTCSLKILNIISLNEHRIEVLDLALTEKLSYFDAEYLYLSKKLGIGLMTYDHYLKKIAAR